MDDLEKTFGLDKLPPPVDRNNQTLTDESAVTPDHRDIKPDGMQKAYVVLNAEERAKGFVRPVRRSYVHVGRPMPTNTRDLTEEEHERYAGQGYVKHEEYHPHRGSVVGRYWTAEELRRAQGGCNAVTRMGLALAETYARDYEFYTHTFCCACRAHFPVGETGEFVWEGTDERVGT